MRYKLTDVSTVITQGWLDTLKVAVDLEVITHEQALFLRDLSKEAIFNVADENGLTEEVLAYTFDSIGKLGEQRHAEAA